MEQKTKIFRNKIKTGCEEGEEERKKKRKKEKDLYASREIRVLIKQAWFLSPSSGIMGRAHYSPDYCFSLAIIEKKQKTLVNTFVNNFLKKFSSDIVRHAPDLLPPNSFPASSGLVRRTRTRRHDKQMFDQQPKTEGQNETDSMGNRSS